VILVWIALHLSEGASVMCYWNMHCG